MPYYVRRMHQEDISQVTEIDHESFMPNVSSKEELKDRLEKLLEWVEKNVE